MPHQWRVKLLFTRYKHTNECIEPRENMFKREPGFESAFGTVSKIWHFRSLHWRPCWLSCTWLLTGGNVSDLVLARNCCVARMLPGEAELVSEWTGLSGRAKSLKRFERSNGLDTVLYKTTFTFYVLICNRCACTCNCCLCWVKSIQLN